MRASWTGTIAFGLVSVPVRLFRAVAEHRVRFHYLHKECRTPLQVRRYCPFHEDVIPWEEVARGYEIAPNEFIVVEEDELRQVGPVQARRDRIEIKSFTDLGEIDPIYFDTSYYAEPLPEGRPAYALLEQAMELTSRVALARMVLRGRELLAAIRPYQRMLLVETLHYADEIRSPSTAALPAEEVSPRELRTAIRLIESLVEPFEARWLVDEAHRRFMMLLEQKAEAQRPGGEGLLGDLQASLREVEAARAGRG